MSNDKELWLQQARDIFKNDLYASELTGIVIEDAAPGYAKCSLEITPKHCNALGKPMGGAVFTIADFAFAIAANLGQSPTVSLSSNISFLSVCKGKKLIAETSKVKAGRSTCLYQVNVYDELGTHVAQVSANGFTVPEKH